MDDILGQIYETVAEPEAWSGVAQSMAHQVKAHANWLIQPGAEGPTLFSFDGIPRSAMAAYADHYHTVDVFVQVGMRRFAGISPGPLRERDILDRAIYQRSEVYNDWLRPNGIDGFLTAALAPITEARPPILSFFRPTGAEPFSKVDVEHFATLLPHMRRAIRIRSAMTGGSGLGPIGLSLLEQIAHAVLLLDGTGCVLHANHAGRSLLDSHDGLQLRRSQLVGVRWDETSRLATILAGCAAPQPLSGEMLLRREDGHALLLAAVPLTGHAGAPFGEARCRICVMVLDPGSNDGHLARRLVALFGLTAAEARVAAAIAEGTSPADIAEAHGVTLPTIRTQTRLVYDKLEVRRQAELVRLLTLLGQLAGVVPHQL
jgi:DNA-binding CsgD family transcriptional regulator/PAS domain-containing protein